MMAESHFRVFKDKFLAKVTKVRIDYLTHIIAVHVHSWYDAKFKRASRPYGYDDPAAWENRFHAEWAAHCAKILAPPKEPANNVAPPKEPANNVASSTKQPSYTTSLQDWTCSCPSYPYSEFLMCKHLVQAYIVDRRSSRSSRNRRRKNCPSSGVRP
ncbi:hypothetical protein SPRG_09224 [Saprolegnia parasitica CBS 223.65]|uniref:SWIM-type domain-containing protein n=1 Tax=Saprolegnia parasitica (strain CBS 223.65) TaxID=695850 RepID=A0A067C3I2_SAPPC|nr:hypothetical protein SPRG_09224 [Saprolegnia parasitica CBS 223.65]KDO25083.1 hypothetical protein SPRG_09224 [Saprolegnia parasitica CBS 223.65]|eukprot:XP_012204157.1 hypothetical protein SPRG_09224 [Saprolegnia parasitica CBS 223.65]